MPVSKHARAPLARAVALGLFMSCVAPHALAQQLVVTDGSTQSATNGTYSTAANGAPTISSSNGSTIDGNTVSATTSGTGSRGVEALTNGVVDLDGVTINTTGVAGVGVFADSGGSVTLNGADITTAGATAWGVHNVAGTITVTDGAISSASRGVMADGGTTTFSNVSTIAAQEAIRAANAGTQVTVAGGTWQSSGAVAVDVRAGARVAMSGASVVGADNRNAVYVDGSTLSMSGGTIASGVAGSGVFLLNGASMLGDGVGISGGDVGIALRDSTLDLTDASISSVLRGLTLSGNDPAGTTRATLTGTTIDAAEDAVALSTADGVTSQLTVSGGTLHGVTAGILANSGTHAVTLSNGAQLTSDSGLLVDVTGRTTVAATLDAVDLAGRLKSDGTNGVLDVAFRNGATLTGSMTRANAVDVAAGTSWHVTDESDVRTLLHTGTIAFTELGADAPFRTLTVHGNYTGNDGLLVLNTVLAGDTITNTDLLHVEGDTSGTARLRILNLGGEGLQTEADGIRVVRVDGVSNATFTLDGRVVAGAYDYNLFKGGVTTDTQDRDGDWYLRSAPTDPGDPGDPEDPPGDPLLRPEVGAYLANQAATLKMFRHHRDHRVAGGRDGEPVEPRGLWVRGYQHHEDGRVAGEQISSGTDTRSVEVGAELMHWMLDKTNLVVGAIYNDGKAESTQLSHVSGYAASGDLEGRAFTLFGTWSTHPGGRTGWYLDHWVQEATFDHRVKGEGLAPEKYRTKRVTGAVEGGYGVRLLQSEGFELVLQPQVQVFYSDFRTPDHREGNGTVVRTEVPGGWSARAGVRLMATIDRVLQPYFEFNAWDDERETAMYFDDTRVALAPAGRVDEYNAGLSVGLASGWSGWASLGVQNGDSGARAAQGQLGVRYRF